MIDQDRVDAFAHCTDDDFFIHVDTEQASKTPLGGTIAHGLLTLSLTAQLTRNLEPKVLDLAIGFNYGYDEIRFITPVEVGKRIRCHVELVEVSKKSDKNYLVRYHIEVEIEGEEKPALVSNWLVMMVSQ